MKAKTIQFILIIIIMSLTACTKSTDDTIVLLGEESYVIPLNDMIPDSLKTSFMNRFGSAPEGFIPPDIEGEYKISAKEFCFSNYLNLSDNQDMYLKISQQHNRVATVDFFECGKIRTDTAFVMGHDQFFTLYFNENKAVVFNGNHIIIHRLVVFKGEKTDNGIKNLYFGNIVMSTNNGVNPYLDPYNSGYYFIYKDKDGFSENCEWF